MRAAAKGLNCDESSIRSYFKRNQVKPTLQLQKKDMFLQFQKERPKLYFFFP
jgi:hypothetical protein